MVFILVLVALVITDGPLQVSNLNGRIFKNEFSVRVPGNYEVSNLKNPFISKIVEIDFLLSNQII